MSNAQTTQEALNKALKDLEAWKAAAQAERDALAATLSEIQQASQDYSDGKITRYDFVKKLAFLAAVQPSQHLAEIRAEAVLDFAKSLVDKAQCPKGKSQKVEYYKTAIAHAYCFANQYAEKIRQGGDV